MMIVYNKNKFSAALKLYGPERGETKMTTYMQQHLPLPSL